MKQKFLLWLAALFAGGGLSTVAWATEPEALNVHRLDATIRSAMLNNVQTIRFNVDETEMVVWTVDQQVLTHSLPEILKVTFGDYLADKETTRVEPYIASPDQIQKVIENGQLVIIQNGVKYNVLGVRL